MPGAFPSVTILFNIIRTMAPWSIITGVVTQPSSQTRGAANSWVARMRCCAEHSCIYVCEQVLSADTKDPVGEGIKDNIRPVSTGPAQRKKAVLGHVSQHRSQPPRRTRGHQKVREAENHHVRVISRM